MSKPQTGAKAPAADSNPSIQYLPLPDVGKNWADTLWQLLQLATEANEGFEFEKAVRYLIAIQDIWSAKGLPEFSLELRFKLHSQMGKALASQGKHDEALKEYHEVLRYCRDSNHLAVRAETFMQVGQLLAKQGDHDRALGYLQRAIGACRRLGDDATLCKALRNLGVVYVELGEFEEAEATYDEAIGVARELSDHMVFADLTNNLGTIMSMRGQWRRALDLYRPSLDIYVAAGERRKAAYCENNMGIAYSEQKLAAHASEYFEKAYQTATEIKDSSLKLIVNINIADLQLKTGNMDKARLHAREAEEQLAASGTVNGHLVETKKIAGMIAVAEGDVETARQRFSEALELARQIGAKFLEAEVLLERGKLHSRDGQNLDALADLESSYGIFKSLNAGGRRLQTETVIHSIEQLYLETFEQMAVEVERKDEYTKGHSDRVATMSLLLAKQLGLQPAELKTIVAAALLHDIGKIKLDDAVLKKDGRLSDDEFAQIKQHPEYAVELLDGKEFPWDVRPSILAHHERLDGTGYPYALKGDDIPLPARIISIADVFDALTSDRVYRPAYDVDRALAIMEGESSTAFDSMLLDKFVEMVRDGRFDWVVNSKTPADEMYSIWSRCMDDDHEPSEPAVDPATMKRVAA